ncbi:hypothetical protein SCALM49S_08277 [Streptomyces californicus]
MLLLWRGSRRQPAGRRRGGGRPEAAADQLRGMWIATVANIDWPSKPGLTAARQKSELLAYLDRAVELRLNTVVFQVRPTADALWPSPHEPWAECLTGTQGKDPGWDPLGTAVREAHGRGLELHAWFNPYRVADHTDPSRLVASHPARKHPDWVVPYGGKLYYNPGLPEVRRFVQDAMLDAVAGTHRRGPLGQLLLPLPGGRAVLDDDAEFERYGGAFADRAAWRRDNIDRLVRETGGASGRSSRASASASAPSRSGATRPPTPRARTPGRACRPRRPVRRHPRVG